MWVFGYGSLMWDGWHTNPNRGCIRSARATFRGYRRAFNKKSVRNWGTRENPGPTLNLIKADGASCHGIAFEFPDDRTNAILEYLREREGRNFAFPRLQIHIDDGSAATAIVPLYEAGDIIATNNARDIAAKVVKARGRDGACIDYVKGIAETLERLNIEDPCVTELWRELRLTSQP